MTRGSAEPPGAEAAPGAPNPPVSALCERMARWEPGATLLALDLDGTLHRGRFRRARGLSNVDLAWEIGWLLRPLGLPIPPPLFSSRVARFALRERALRRHHGEGRAYYEGAIDGFRREIAAAVPASVLAKAVDRMPSLAHPELAASLGLLRGRIGRVLILSKAFQPVVDAYASAIRAMLPGVGAGGVGNPIAPGEPLLHVSGDDKAGSLREWLAANASTRSCLVVGDTAHDLAMGCAAAERLGADNAAMIAVAPKSSDFARSADAAFPDWRALAAALVPDDRGGRDA
jgi:hypothetical protein